MLRDLDSGSGFPVFVATGCYGVSNVRVFYMNELGFVSVDFYRNSFIDWMHFGKVIVVQGLCFQNVYISWFDKVYHDQVFPYRNGLGFVKVQKEYDFQKQGKSHLPFLHRFYVAWLGLLNVWLWFYPVDCTSIATVVYLCTSGQISGGERLACWRWYQV